MRNEQRHEQLISLKKEIDSKLQDLSFQARKDLILWLSKSKEFKKLKIKDNQLIYLDRACNIWIKEKKTLTSFGIWEDFFSGITLLDELEEKYTAVKFAALRFETEMPKEYYLDGIHRCMKRGISGIAIFEILMRETLYKEKNSVDLSRLLKEAGYNIQAFTLLQEAAKKFDESQEIRLELADCWLSEERLEEAYACLKEVKSPSDEIRLLIKALEEGLGYEELQ